MSLPLTPLRVPVTPVASTLAKDRLGISSVAFFVITAAAPLTVVAGTLATAYAVTGNLGLPAAFAVVGLELLVFSVGYVTMSRHLPHAGAFYAYASHGLGRTAGVSTAWVALAAYNMIQVSLYGAIGAAVSPLAMDWFGVDLPWWVFAVVAWAVIALLGVLRIDLNGGVLAVLLLAEITLIVVFDGSYLLHPAHGMSWGSWSVSELFAPGVGAIIAISMLGFVGFESAVVFAEESRNPARTIPRTTYLSVVLIAVLYGVSSWAMAVAAGPAQIADAATKQGPDLVFNLASAHLGGGAATLGHVLFATSIVAAGISFHNTIARYMFALGRERVLPAAFGRTSASGSPRVGSIAQSAIGLTVIVVYAVGGWDPVIKLFYTASTSGALGVLLLLVFAGLAVLRFFAHDRRGEDTWHTLTAPALALVGLSVMLVLVLANFATLLGVPETDPLRWGIPAVFAVTALIGAGYGLWLKALRPETFAAIGMGAKAALVPPVDHTPYPASVPGGVA